MRNTRRIVIIKNPKFVTSIALIKNTCGIKRKVIKFKSNYEFLLSKLDLFNKIFVLGVSSKSLLGNLN